MNLAMSNYSHRIAFLITGDILQVYQKEISRKKTKGDRVKVINYSSITDLLGNILYDAALKELQDYD